MKKEYLAMFDKNDYDTTIAQQLSLDIEEIYRNLRNQRKEIKVLILQSMLQQRIQQNFAGRIKRIIEQIMQKKF